MGLMDLGEAGDTRKKGATTCGREADRKLQRDEYSQSMTKLPSGWGAGVGTWCE